MSYKKGIKDSEVRGAVPEAVKVSSLYPPRITGRNISFIIRHLCPKLRQPEDNDMK
jgi:hypothetical protein